MALWIEDLQQCICVDSEGEQELTNAKAVELHCKCVRLAKQVKLFRKAQLIYLPGAALHLAEEAAEMTKFVDMEDQKLWLPSDFDSDIWETSCQTGLPAIEESLCEAQCLDALESIWSSQQTMRAFLAFWNRNL
ncbi:uncharacterized protein ARMOST_06227 [Armillaria ostoyae]|uniref:Uncharacterized protein n=1 Tax=Armillaria ostoyae TaxID=47428 RepID=A0A284R2G6_ARMOS|nr:uncharacterized protein ARMOST_06227 [Armillaria ostoyae]